MANPHTERSGDGKVSPESAREDTSSQFETHHTGVTRSTIFLILLALLSLLVGAIGGFFLAAQAYSSQCEVVLKEAQLKYEERYRHLTETIENNKDQSSSKECSLGVEKTELCADEIERAQVLTSKVEALEGVNDRYTSVLLDLKECNSDLDHYLAKINSSESEELLKRDLDNAMKKLQICQEDFEAHEEKYESLKDDHDDLDSYSLELSQQRDQVQRELELSVTREKGWIQRVDYMKQYVANWSRRTVIERFGNGPHRVIFSLYFPGDTPEGIEEKHQFVIELAPIDLMPHAVHTFLDMVSRQLYNGCYFAIGSNAMLAVAPESRDATKRMNLFGRFERLGFVPSLAYQEHHSDFPHGMYTVAFSGGPPVGGPAFYISVTNDISELGHSDEEITDDYGVPLGKEPCFGKVVEGFEVIDRIKAIPREPAYGFGWFSQQVMVESAIVDDR